MSELLRSCGVEGWPCPARSAVPPPARRFALGGPAGDASTTPRLRYQAPLTPDVVFGSVQAHSSVGELQDA